MNDRVLVEALRSRDPGALAALYDTHAEGVYRYCRSLLGNPDGAQVSLRDALIAAAEAHIGSLSDPDRLRPWLYAFARGECLRRHPPGLEDLAESQQTEESRRSDPADADLKAVAFRAVRGLSWEDREILDLTARHGFDDTDLATILGVSRREAETAHEAAVERLRDALTAEILARRPPGDCAELSRLLADVTGVLLPETRDQVIEHIAGCDVCASHRVRHVSGAKVFGLLPVAAFPDTLRLRIMSCFTDPELVPYRRYVARRVGALDASGFPAVAARTRSRLAQGAAGAMAAVATVAAVALAFIQFAEGGDRAADVGSYPATGEPPGVRLPWTAAPQDVPMLLVPIAGRQPTSPVDSRELAEPVVRRVPVARPMPIARPRPTPFPPPSRPREPAPDPTREPRPPYGEPPAVPPDKPGKPGRHGTPSAEPSPGVPGRPSGRPQGPKPRPSGHEKHDKEEDCPPTTPPGLTRQSGVRPRRAPDVWPGRPPVIGPVVGPRTRPGPRGDWYGPRNDGFGPHGGLGRHAGPGPHAGPGQGDDWPGGGFGGWRR